jgi:GNAT superfamily N-acetyltransferase
MTTVPDLHIAVLPTADLSLDDRDAILTLFRQNYREANAAYLERSLDALAFAAIARDPGGRPAGFALGEPRVIDLPRLPAQPVRLAGLCCVDPAFRRQGLFRRLEQAALSARTLPPAPRWLSAGRVAHPASFRGMSANPTVVPRRGWRPTPWQQQVGAAVAAAYGTREFDPETFVCRGTGTPIGWPVIEIVAAPEEWELFRQVDRSRGDSLLGIAWHPDGPPGWDDPSA